METSTPRSGRAVTARGYIGSSLQAQQDVGAAAELRRLMEEVDAKPGYLALRAHVRWELGRAYLFDYDWTQAIATLSEAVDALGSRIGSIATGALL